MKYYAQPYFQKKYYNTLAALSAPMRESQLFWYYTQEIPVWIEQEDVFAGWYGFQESDNLVEEEIKDFPRSAVLSEEERAFHRHLEHKLKTSVIFATAHTCIDYQTVIDKGLIYYKTRIEEELSKDADNEMLKAMKLGLEAACAYSLRFAEAAKVMEERTEVEQEKARYHRMYEALCRVPQKPARDFYEAVQCLWLMHCLVPIAEKGWASISVGRMDQYLYPYYQKAIADGIPKEEIKDILKHLFRLLDSYGDGACAMNLGGMDIDGNDMMNELSELLIEVEKEMCLRAPIVAVRVSPKTPERILDSLIDFDLFKIGQPTFYSELPCRKAVMGRGISEEEAATFSTNSCMGLILAGSEFANMWAIKFNAHLPLELALNGGNPFHDEMGITLKTQPKQITCMEDLITQYREYFAELLEICARLYKKVAEEQAQNGPDPFVSALTEGCIEARGDRATCAKYDTVTVETMGLINTCDAIEAICELVFDQKKYTLAQLVEATKRNFEDEDALLQDIRSCNKFGMNEERTNIICKQLTENVSEACKKQSGGNLIYVPSLHTIDENVGYGRWLYATADGRKQGDPVNKNANPSNLLKKTDHTSHILSAVTWDQTAFSGGQPIDLYFDKVWFETKESRDKIKSLILTYLKLGGLQLQVNSVDIELLEKAHKAPDDYPYVIVRKGGYSVRFNEMSEPRRAEFIEVAKRLEQRV